MARSYTPQNWIRTFNPLDPQQENRVCTIGITNRFSWISFLTDSTRFWPNPTHSSSFYYKILNVFFYWLIFNVCLYTKVILNFLYYIKKKTNDITRQLDEQWSNINVVRSGLLLTLSSFFCKFIIDFFLITTSFFLPDMLYFILKVVYNVWVWINFFLLTF